MGTEGIGIFISALASQLIYQVVHLHCFDVPPEALGSYVDAVGVTQRATSVPVLICAGVVHEVLCQSPWHKPVAIFSSALEPCSAAVSV